MRVLHTSDWHLGAGLLERSRHEEQAAFLAWLADRIRELEVDTLLVAGDIYDSANPPSRATGLYFKLLSDLHGTACRNVVVIGGNHDSPAYLNAPADYLGHFGVHVLGCAPADRSEEVLVLPDRDGGPGLILCAVPFLRDRDVRQGVFGQSTEERLAAQRQGILAHYQAAAEEARRVAAELSRPCPVFAMGHLFAQGSLLQDGEGEFTVGTLDAVDASSFRNLFLYTALGHLHSPQCAGSDRVRYSGSPIPMSFREGKGAPKEVVILDIDREACTAGPEEAGDPSVWEGALSITTLPVPCFQEMAFLQGTLPELEEALAGLSEEKPGIWVALDCTGSEAPSPDWRERLREAAGGTVEILRFRDRTPQARSLLEGSLTEGQDLSELTPLDIFRQRLETANVPEDRHAGLTELFTEILAGFETAGEDREEGGTGA